MSVIHRLHETFAWFDARDTVWLPLTMASGLASVVANCDEIGSYVKNTEFIISKYGGGSALHGHNSSKPFEYLKEWCWTRSWDEFFNYIMDL